MSNPTTISGMLDAKGLKIAILATRFNDFIVDRHAGNHPRAGAAVIHEQG